MLILAQAAGSFILLALPASARIPSFPPALARILHWIHKTNTLILMKTLFYRCDTCGNVVVKIVDSKAPLSCCGKPMRALEPNVVTAENRKYQPEVVLLEDRRLRIVPCPGGHCVAADGEKMFLYVEFGGGGTWLDAASNTDVVLPIGIHRPIAVYKYCSRHGLWRVEV